MRRKWRRINTSILRSHSSTGCAFFFVCAKFKNGVLECVNLHRNSTTLWHLIGGSRKGRGDRINLLGLNRRFNNCNRWLCATRFKTNKSGAPAAPNTAGIDYSGRSCYWETSAHRRRPMDVGCLSLYLFSANRCAANAVSSSPVSDTSCSRCRFIDMSHQKNPRTPLKKIQKI